MIITVTMMVMVMITVTMMMGVVVLMKILEREGIEQKVVYRKGR